MIKWILTKIVGTKNQREVRRLRPIVEQIVSIEESWNGKGQEFLLEKTREWQGYLHRFLPMDLPPVRIVEAAPREELEEIAAKLNARFESLKEEFASLPTVEATPASIEEGKAAWNNITPQFDKLRERYLNQILPEAFAAVKHGARLLCGEERDICGQKQVWDMVHFDVQLLGGIALHRGYIAEMATGEGKTLVATLPVYLNALTGMGVHVVTVNDYLARRDSEWMGMLFQFLGLTVGCIQSMMPSQLRREQYACDITYGTNAEFGFDYLRDNGMATSKSEQVQRGHYFSIVDEVDSILIDEARTPLIISGPAVVTREQQYDTLRPAIERVVKAQTDLCNELMAQALKAQEEGRTEEVGRCLFKVKMGQPRHRAFLRAMQDPELRRIVEKYELTLYQDTRKKELYKLKEEMFFTVDEKTHDADLMEKGREVISPGHPEDFVLPDLGTAFAEMDEDPRLTEKDKLRRKNELTKQLDETGARLHTTSQLLKAYCIYEKDVEYVVKEGKVIIIDQNTGREMPGRRWSDGLHQAVEAKEGVEVERENQTYATITIQNYFRLYKKLAGMTGTAETEAAEFHDIYKLDVLPIPTNRPCIRKDQNDLIFKSRREKFNAVVNKIQELHDKGQPILIGTASVDASETLSRMLKRAKIPHEVLNAKNHQREAEIVAQAGKRGAVTVSTNMAGRGTDIKLGEGVADLGGLFVLGTERHESRRIDRQLRGRCSRQGDPGASQFFISFEDDLMRNFGAAGQAPFLDFAAQLQAQPCRVDLLQTSLGIGIDICAAGLDAQVAYGIPKFRRLPGCGGTAAYTLSILQAMLSRFGHKLRVAIDGKEYTGTYMMAAICNGGYYGGGYQAAPYAAMDDGLLDIVLVKPISRIQVAGILAKYKAGRHMQDADTIVPEFRSFMTFYRARSVEMQVLDNRPIIATIDGECAPVMELKAEVLPSALNVLLPRPACGSVVIRGLHECPMQAKAK